jgi:hypothetical protein
MTSPPSPPNRRKRRILVMIVALALASFIAWWYWPRGDARFVGEWEWWIEDRKSPEMLIKLHRSGTAEIADLRAPTPTATTTSWTVRYNCLCFGFDRKSDWHDEMVRAANIVIGALHLNFEPRGHGHLVLDATNPDEIRLSPWMILSGDPNILLRRRGGKPDD